jgi:hypothetical protein
MQRRRGHGDTSGVRSRCRRPGAAASGLAAGRPDSIGSRCWPGCRGLTLAAGRPLAAGRRMVPGCRVGFGVGVPGPGPGRTGRTGLVGPGAGHTAPIVPVGRIAREVAPGGRVGQTGPTVLVGRMGRKAAPGGLVAVRHDRTGLVALVVRPALAGHRGRACCRSADRCRRGRPGIGPGPFWGAGRPP